MQEPDPNEDQLPLTQFQDHPIHKNLSRQPQEHDFWASGGVGAHISPSLPERCRMVPWDSVPRTGHGIPYNPDIIICSQTLTRAPTAPGVIFYIL